MILEAANYDPLRAQEIEEQLTGEWWGRYLVDRRWRVEAQKLEAEKNKREAIKWQTKSKSKS